MSTFNGFVTEFPRIRIDCFRKIPDQPPPLACFLSHVHSDHLLGLESLKSPFVYCTPATREILLRLEKYPHRMNFTTGLIESRKQTYRHLRNLLKTIPLDTPTRIELSPSNDIRVTLIDANHCPGACMFLIEGDNKAILYTGDIRAEPWWVQSIARHPSLLPWLLDDKSCKVAPKLDALYLDTTFATKDSPFRTFSPKANGIRELLSSIQRYPKDTTFYLESWTFGYEHVWLALSAALGSKVHLDRYRLSIYQSLAPQSSARQQSAAVLSPEGPALGGFLCGNHPAPGCVTSETGPDVRIHSCERGTYCAALEEARRQGKLVRLAPVVNRLASGEELQELGVGGGEGDLSQIHELDFTDSGTTAQLRILLTKITTGCEREKEEEDIRFVVERFEAINADSLTPKRLRLDPQLASAQLGKSIHADNHDVFGDMPIRAVIELIATQLRRPQSFSNDRKSFTSLTTSNTSSTATTGTTTISLSSLPAEIRFPYSRHSSYDELCDLVETLKPRDIVPCTVPPVAEWTPELTMKNLFGHLVEAESTLWSADREMLGRYAAYRDRNAYQLDANEESDDRGPGVAMKSTTVRGKRKWQDDHEQEEAVTSETETETGSE